MKTNESRTKILELLAKGSTNQEILEDYPELQPEDIQAGLFYAYYLVSQEELLDRVTAPEIIYEIGISPSLHVMSASPLGRSCANNNV